MGDTDHTVFSRKPSAAAVVDDVGLTWAGREVFSCKPSTAGGRDVVLCVCWSRILIILTLYTDDVVGDEVASTLAHDSHKQDRNSSRPRRTPFELTTCRDTMRNACHACDERKGDWSPRRKLSSAHSHLKMRSTLRNAE